jgi:hypothetical protein
MTGIVEAYFWIYATGTKTTLILSLFLVSTLLRTASEFANVTVGYYYIY